MSLALDTNVLVRFLVRDDEAQHERARALVEGAIAKDETCFVSDVVVCELVWVLGTSYRVPRGEIAKTLGDLLRARHLRFERPDRLRTALRSYAASNGAFADYLIREHAREAGCDALATFDRNLQSQDLFLAP